MINNTIIADKINISDYDYHLPDSSIAKYPTSERDQSKLLCYRNEEIEEYKFPQITSLLTAEHTLIFNNSRVIPARLHFYKKTGAMIEIFCLEPIDPADYQQSFQSRSCTWKCIVGNLKKWKEEPLIKEISVFGRTVSFKAQKAQDNISSQYINFSWDDDTLSFSEIIEMTGVTPIPPYLNRESESVDKERYQTIYSRIKGSVAAPTAGLHFTENVLQSLVKKGIKTAQLTLHVGAGTFKPVQTDSIASHEMHTEYFTVSKESLEQLIANPNRLVSVGTTTLRTLESLYWIAVKIEQNLINSPSLHVNQWDAFQLKSKLSYQEALQVLLDHLKKTRSTEFSATTQILIAPGYAIRSIEAIITNFHQPKSTLLLLVAAITGKNWKRIYEYALLHEFRFLSYGDSSILFLR